jgi:hypothetical protein
MNFTIENSWKEKKDFRETKMLHFEKAQEITHTLLVFLKDSVIFLGFPQVVGGKFKLE